MKLVVKMLYTKQRPGVEIAMKGHNLAVIRQAGSCKSLLLRKIVDKWQQVGKKVSVTCSTGIACLQFPSKYNRAQTVHRWGCLEDGRHTTDELTRLVMDDERFEERRAVTRNTDVLVLDEVSMISTRIIGQLHSLFCY